MRGGRGLRGDKRLRLVREVIEESSEGVSGLRVARN